MKKLTALLFTLGFSLSVSAGVGNSQVGPMVECQLPDGSLDYVPAVICDAEDGKVL